MEFRAVVELGGRTATGIEVPAGVVEALASGKRPKVAVTIGSHTYRTTVTPMGGRYLIPLSAENRSAAGVSAGDLVLVTMEPDTAPREVDVPDYLADVLDADPAVRARFDALAYSHRKEHVRAIEDAKAEATRARRIEKMLAMLRG